MRLSLFLLLIATGFAHAEPLPSPSVRQTGAAFLTKHNDHEFFVETELRVPVLRLSPFGAMFRYRETTPFIPDVDGTQAEVLYRQYELQLDAEVADWLRAIGVTGYRISEAQDRPGRAQAGVIGAGLGSPWAAETGPLQWSVLAGSFFAKDNLPADVWLDTDLRWRLTTYYHLDVILRGRYELLADRHDTGWLAKVGPELQFQTAFGNRCGIYLAWYENEDHYLLGSNERGLMLGLEVATPLRAPDRPSPVAHRPFVWGVYELGATGHGVLQRFELNADLWDFSLRDHKFTTVVNYESRQEHRRDNYDHIVYTVSVGLQTPLAVHTGLVVGADWVHRSDHALNPPADRVPPGLQWLDNGSMNIVPQLRLQTRGWDLPHRARRAGTGWLLQFDWRVAGGPTAFCTRDRGRFAAQIGVNWDIAQWEGNVFYLRGVASAGNASPDWSAEAGLRAGRGKVFARVEDYGVNRNIGRGEVFVAGLGVNL